MTAIEHKKILYIITKSVLGGAGKHVYDLATSLPKDVFEVTVALGGNGPLVQKLETMGIKTISLSSLKRDVDMLHDSSSFFNIYKIIKNVKPDIVHLHSSKVGGLGSLAARLLGISKIIFTAHGWAFKEKRGYIERLLIKIVSWITIILSHETIVVSENDRQAIQNFPFIKNKIRLIHNGVANITLNNKNDARKLLSKNIPDLLLNKTWVGTIAELHKNKGLIYAVEAFAKLKKENTVSGLSFIIIGEGEERKNLTNFIIKDDLTKNVFLVGQKDDVSSLLPAFDIFILPSIKEGLPYVILEAGQASLPVIATTAGGIPEIIKDMESGILVRPQDSNEIVAAIKLLLAQPEKQTIFGTNLKKTVEREFTLSKMLEETTKTYTENF